jgi:hypothetical protein|nr:MAG TPA: UBA-like domain protein [Caudoviricetes sp.]
MKFEDYKDNAIVKSMLAMGFTEDYIAKSIEKGDIKIEKNEDAAAAGDHESETKQEKDIDKLEKEAVKKEEKVKDDEKDTAEDRDAEGIKKAVEETFAKSMGVFAPIMEKMAETLDVLSDKIDKIGGQTPSFRSAGLENVNAIQKSMQIAKDENNKYEMNIISQRPLVVKAIEKAYDQMSETLQKSMEGDMLAYLTNPEAETVGQELAQYMYDKCDIKLCK